MDFVEELREDFLICNICFEEYREPKQLPCLHTFCRPCLVKYIVGKVLETGTDWFPCPFCRKSIRPPHDGELRSWADMFPSNFFLSQLSSKLKDKAALRHQGHIDVSSDADHMVRAKCPEHPQAYLVAYCTRQRRGACEECCAQRHVDCIRYHVRERDSKVMAEERLAEYRETVGVLQGKLRGIRDTVSAQEGDLGLRNEQLQLQTQSALSDAKSKLDLFLLEQKRHLARQLDALVEQEKKRLASLKQHAADLATSLEQAHATLDPISGGGGGGARSAVSDLVVLDRVGQEVKRQRQALDRLRKDCALSDIQFVPNRNLDSVLQGLSLGSLTAQGKPQRLGGARPRIQRFASEPYSFREGDPSAYLPAHRASPPAEGADFSPRRSRERGRALSPPGGAASALSASPAAADGEMEMEELRGDARRERSGAPRRVPTVPDFGATLIEESRRSKSVPRRPRPVSDGATPTTAPRRRPPPIETAIDASLEEIRNTRVLELSPEITPPGVGGAEAGAGGDDQQDRAARGGGYRNSGSLAQLASSSEDEAVLSGNITTYAGGTGNTGRDGPPSVDSDGSGSEAERKIVCVRHFLATHESDVKNTPGLVGVSAVCRDRVAACDRWNKAVKLLDISGRVLHALIVPGAADAEPWDLALRRPGLLAVTYPKEQKIRMLDVHEDSTRLAYRSHFNTRHGYASIATCDPSSLVASVCPPFGNPKIHVIDYLGTILRAIDCATVAYPRCVDMCGGEQVCVADWTHHNVKIFSREGAVAHCYTGVPGAADAQLKTPMGVAWDGRGSVFVVDGKTAKLHAVSTATGACSVIFSLAHVSGAELKLVTFVEASPELCLSEKALVVTTTSGSIQVYDLCSY